jgi:hypothetical protein
MGGKEKYSYAVVNSAESKQIVNNDFIFKFGSDFNSFLKSADINIKLNKAAVHVALGFFVAGLFLVKLLLWVVSGA